MTASESAPPGGCTWERYLEELATAHGGWAALVDMLIHRADEAVELPRDPLSIERGLRRLKKKGNGPGGQYGRWVLRFFGVPEPLSVSARWMGCYHSRFGDLPVSLCESQLRLWDRPPICESSLAAWIHLGLANVAMRRRDPEGAADRLGRASAGAERADPAARVEALLLEARLESDGGFGERVDELLDTAAGLVAAVQPEDERACYGARIADQRAYRVLRSGRDPATIARAEALYAALPAATASAFVRFRREHGLAYCRWKRGEVADALASARAACSHAGDGGLVRFRAMALDLAAHIAPEPEAGRLRARAERMAALIEHEDLLRG